jgi:hypothetical protein
LKRALGVLRSGLTALFGFLFGAILWVGLLVSGGAVLLLVGIHMLVGAAWTLIAAGIVCVLLAAVIVLGLRNAP